MDIAQLNGRGLFKISRVAQPNRGIGLNRRQVVGHDIRGAGGRLDAARQLRLGLFGASGDFWLGFEGNDFIGEPAAQLCIPGGLTPRRPSSRFSSLIRRLVISGGGIWFGNALLNDSNCWDSAERESSSYRCARNRNDPAKISISNATEIIAV